MNKQFLWVVLLCGCAFDLSALGPRDGGDSSVEDAEVGDAEMLVDASDAEPLEEDAGSDSGVDSGPDDAGTDASDDPDAWVADAEVGDAGTDAGPCASVPDISGVYRITRRLSDCTSIDYGGVLWSQDAACTYEVGVGSTSFFGSCLAVVGAPHEYECAIQQNSTNYICLLTRYSSGLSIECSDSIPGTDNCNFNAPRM